MSRLASPLPSPGATERAPEVTAAEVQVNEVTADETAPPDPVVVALEDRHLAPMTRAAVKAMVAMIALSILVMLAVGPGPFVLTAQVITVACTAALAFLGARRSPYRVVSMLIATGIAVSGTGDLVYTVSTHFFGEVPDVSVADLFWLGAYVVAGAAVLRLPRGGGLDRDGMVDIAVIFVVAMVIQWEITFNDVLTDPSLSIRSRVVQSLYPTFDAALLALVVRAAVTRRLQGPVALLIGVGVAIWLSADFGLFLGFGGRDNPLIALALMISGLLFAASTWVPSHRTPSLPVDPRTGAERAGRGGIAIALLPVMVPANIALFQELTDDVRNPVLLYMTTLLLVGLAYARGTRILHDESAARAALRSQERFAQAAAVNSSDALALLDEDGVILADASQLATLVGHHGAPTVGRDVFALIGPEDHDDSRAVFEQCLTVPSQTFETEFRVSHSAGHPMWLSARMINLLDDPAIGGVLVTIHDISDRRRAEDELVHQAFHDGLTGLANRALFGDRIDHALRRNGRSGVDPVVIYLDLDGFKTVNDSLGHGAGDQLLCEVSDRLTASVRPGDTVARLGGDEFAVLLDQSPDPLGEAKAIADRILRALEDPMVLDGHTVTVSASLGIAVGDSASTTTSLLRDADVAMYRAKSAGKSRWVVHDHEMRSAAVERLHLESDIITALEHDQLTLVYQPVVRLDSDEIVGFEALLRWEHPALGSIAPDRFIPIAEETGLIVPIGRWVIQEATAALARWQRQLPGRELSIAVNVSGRQLASTDLVDDVASTVARSGVKPSDLVIEITETSLIQDTVVAADRLGALSDLGVRVAVDDFGTGYSSLRYLRQFPIDILKIDQSFISNIDDQAQIPALVRGLLHLGRVLDLETVAEGVELESQRDQLQLERCDYAQGFLFSAPVDDAEAFALLNAEVSHA